METEDTQNLPPEVYQRLVAEATALREQEEKIRRSFYKLAFDTAANIPPQSLGQPVNYREVIQPVVGTPAHWYLSFRWFGGSFLEDSNVSVNYEGCPTTTPEQSFRSHSRSVTIIFRRTSDNSERCRMILKENDRSRGVYSMGILREDCYEVRGGTPHLHEEFDDSSSASELTLVEVATGVVVAYSQAIQS